MCFLQRRKYREEKATENKLNRGREREKSHRMNTSTCTVWLFVGLFWPLVHVFV